MAFRRWLVVAFCCAASVESIKNGLGLTPQMGYNSWYDVGMGPTEELVKATVDAMKSNGLYDAGYRYVNLDDGMVIGRDSNGQLYPDPAKFPSGFASLADYIHQNGMMFGVYTDRGPTTCGGRPAAFGHEVLDANTYAKWGVDYVKEDSCNAAQDHQTAFAEYATMRDALAAAGNVTGRTLFFSLCGWENWYAPVGHTLGNSWRIGPDDTNWDGVLVDIDADEPLWPYAGPGGWNDPCLLLGRDMNGNVAVSDQQGRFQFTMWAILAAPMLLSQNVRNLSAFQLETYLNQEVIAVGQDPLGRQGQRLVGGPISIQRSAGDDVPVTLQECTTSSLTGTAPTAQQWKWNVSALGYLTNAATGTCLNADDCGSDLILYQCVTTGGTCCGANCYNNLVFYIAGDGTLRTPMAPTQCVTAAGVGNQVYLQPCLPGSASQQFAYDSASQTLSTPSNQCLTGGGASGSRANVWGRPLADGSWALAFVNADITAVDLTCGIDCLSITGWEPEQRIAVRDLWAHADLDATTTAQGFNVTSLAADGGVVMVKLTPMWTTNSKPVA
eukprot:TRINITY_DN19879_c0_g1_i1.p1 TRINITY_DN19879_c0_g1~~TRINITY_DN19879_c0_g1_i1.p1  ORF type:complete len:555 (+),score=132.94 TRINITY_DN19879_c0_g1_i1:131-1795(+)